MRYRPEAILKTAAVVVFLAGTCAEVIAIPTFARRYQTSCATCHQAFPRLNAVGEAFRIAGFRFVDDELYRKVEQIELGDEAYKRLWPESLWPTSIPRTAPLSFVNRFMAEVDLDGTRQSDVTFLLPEEVELVWADSLGDDFAFYGDIIFLQKDFGGQDLASWATVKAWLQFQDLFGAEDWLNLRVGTVGTQTMGLFTARDANTYGTHFYLYSSWVMPPVDLAQAGLSDFKGNNFNISPQAGVELNGFGERWFYALGYVKGDLDVAFGAQPDSDISFVGMGPSQRNKDVYLQLAYKFGGLPWGPRPDSQTNAKPTMGGEFWRDDHFIVSLFGYSGAATIRGTELTGTKWHTDDDFWRAAVGVEGQYKDVTVGAAYMAGSDDRPYGFLSDRSVDSAVWHVETLWFAYPWLIPFARYEGIDLDMPLDIPGVRAEQDIARVLAGAKIMIRPNIFLTAEGVFYTKGAELEEGFDQTVFVLLSVAF